MTGLLTTFFVVAIVQAVCGSDVVASSKPYQPVVVEGGQYFVHLAIGTPPQRFFAQVSTTTSYSWVPDSSCLCPKICSAGGFACDAEFCDKSSECCDDDFINGVAKPRRGNLTAGRFAAYHLPGYGECSPDRHRFNSSASSTYKKDGVIFETHFNDTEIKWRNDWSVWGVGFMGYDTFQLGTMVVKHAMFGQATQIELRSDIQGVLGLGPSGASPAGTESLIVTAFKQRRIEQPVASVVLTPDLDMPAITYGGKDDAYCGPIIAWHNISASSDACK